MSEAEGINQVKNDEVVKIIERAKEELRLLRAKDTASVYDITLRLDIDSALQKLNSLPRLRVDFDDQLKEFLGGAHAFVEADRYSAHMLWYENCEKLEWIECNHGLGEIIGYVGDMPVNLSLTKATVDGKLIIFYDAVSMVVDHSIVEDWVSEIAKLVGAVNQYGRIRKTDAMNFHNVLGE